MSADTNPASLLTPIIVGSLPGHRSPQSLTDVVAWLDVEHRLRYKVRDIDLDGDLDTFCNIFLWDWSRCMGAEIPHWVDSEGRPVLPAAGKELSANGVCEWLEAHGLEHGWRRIGDRDEANKLAALGVPVCVTWRNVPGKPGHVAVVLPPDKGYTMIAQAGARNSSRLTLEQGFGSHPVKFWASV
jgi:hypothetical protein